MHGDSHLEESMSINFTNCKPQRGGLPHRLLRSATHGASWRRVRILWQNYWKSFRWWFIRESSHP